jgi:hypothetical protein
VEDENGIFARKGELKLRDVTNDFDRVPVLKFTGLNQLPKKPLVIKRVDQDVPAPIIYRASTEEAKEEQDEMEEIGETAIIWYGEEVGKGRGTRR